MDPNKSLIPFVLAFAFLIGLAILGVVIRIRRPGVRAKDVQEVAPSLSLTPVAATELLADANGKGSTILDALRAGCGLESGRRGQVLNLLRGRWGSGDLWFFDFDFGARVQGGKQTLQGIAVSVELAKPVPAFRICPEGLVDRIAAAFGGQDIDFTDHPEFSKLYRLRGEDEAAVRAAFSPAVIAAFVARPGLSLVAKKGHLVLFTPPGIDEELPSAKAAEFVRNVQEIAAVLGG